MKEGIKLTCTAGKEVTFTFCVVQKKINERFFTCRVSASVYMSITWFPQKLLIFLFVGQGTGFENPAPGSVLDHTVTRRYNYDFFLVPQLVRQVECLASKELL